MNPTPNPPAKGPNTDSDPLLDRTLAHLAGTEPAPDLNARLLRHLETQKGTQATREQRPRWGCLLLPVPVVAAVVALLLSHAPSSSHPATPDPLTQLNQSKLQNSQRQTEQEHALLPTQTAHPRLTSQTPSTDHPKLNPSQLAAEQGTPLLTAQTAQPRLKTQTPAQAEAQALDDLHAPSQPAPPLPLTAQERAILHLLHRDGTVELAQLDPALQTELFELQQASFQQFFDPPPPPKPEGETK